MFAEICNIFFRFMDKHIIISSLSCLLFFHLGISLMRAKEQMNGKFWFEIVEIFQEKTKRIELNQ